MAKQKKVKINPSHEGLLHKDTHTPLGQPIPMGKKEAAAHSEDPAVRKRAVFALNFGHGRGERVSQNMQSMRQESARAKRARILESHKHK